MSTAAKIDLIIEKGTTFKKAIFWKDKDKNPVNLVGYSARMQIRKSINSNNFLIELTTENGGIVLTPPEGKIEIIINSDITASLEVSNGVYDLELIDTESNVIKIAKGYVAIIGEITK